MDLINKEPRCRYWATCSSIRSFAGTAHFAHSQARGTVNNWMAIYSVFFSILAHSGEEEPSHSTSKNAELPKRSVDPEHGSACQKDGAGSVPGGAVSETGAGLVPDGAVSDAGVQSVPGGTASEADAATSHFRPLVISGPSGSGKSSILKRVMAMEKFKDKIAFCVSHTTR